MQTISSKASQRVREGAPRLHVLPSSGRVAFSLLITLFFLWGMSNNLTDILVQQFRKAFVLSQAKAQLVQTAVFAGYFIMALPAALLMKRWGYKGGILLGLALFGSGLTSFWPAASTARYGPFLLALFLVGCGSAVLETAANPLVILFGPSETSEQRLNFAQAFNPPGTIAGVLIGTYYIFSGIEPSALQVVDMKRAGVYASYLHTELMRVVPVYVGLGATVIVLAAVIASVRFPPAGDVDVEDVSWASFRQLVRTSSLWQAVVAQFFYCGAQVTTWSAFIPYVKQYTALSERQAGWLLTANLVLLFAGRITSTTLMQRVRPHNMVSLYAFINMLLVLYGSLRPGLAGVYVITISSFFMSIMYPTIFAIGVKGLGENTKIGSAFIVMSVVGGAVLPLALGLVARATESVALGYIVVVLAYLCVLVYSLSRRRPGRRMSEWTIL